MCFAAMVAKVEENPPNRILKLTGLPPDITSDRLQALFAQFPGFKVCMSYNVRFTCHACADELLRWHGT